MKRKIICIFVCILMFSSVVRVMSSPNISLKPTGTEPTGMDYSHNILGEFGTRSACEPCAIAHSALKIIYKNDWHPFYYISLICSKNKHAHQRAVSELGLIGYPTVFWDGGYRQNGGASGIQDAMDRYNYSIIKCGERNVKDIDLSLEVEWLGAVNNEPEDGETEVPVEQVMRWTISEMEIDAEVTNNEASQYNGHLHMYVTEINSTMWNDNFGNPYTFAFLDYAFNEDVTLSGGGSWDDTISWDGIDYNDGYGNYFENIIQDNTMVIAAVFNEDNNDYVDETVGFRAGDGTDHKKFDIYFGDSTPPPMVASNTSKMFYTPLEDLNFSTAYYWKIDVWDALGNPIFGDIWSFTTRDNNPPNTPVALQPWNGSSGISIDTDLLWSGDDPDGDETTYDVYFGEYDPYEDPPQVAWNITTTSYDPSPYDNNFEFDTKYEWMIVAWDEYGLSASGGPFTFTTEENLPPDPAYNPIPPDGANNVPGNAILYWNGSDPNSGDKLTYDVYFGPNDPPSLKSTNQEENHWKPYDMPLFEDFYWKIVARDREGEEAEGTVWSFKTGVNPPPTNPEIKGPDRGPPKIDYNFTFASTDEDNQSIKYYVNWGDGNSVETGYHESGEVVTLNHTWNESGTYNIKAKAEDIYGEKSGDSKFEINIPRNKAVNFNFNLLSWLFERFPHAFPILRYLLGL